jgi:hypothetical protein
VASRLTRPDFIWSPYPDFVSALYQTSWRASASYIHTFSPGLLNEFRGAYGDDNLSWNRPHSEVGALVSLDGVTLPGSPAFFAFKNRNRNWEFLDNIGWSLGRNRLTLGGGALLRTSDGFQTAGRDPLYAFSDIANFAADQLTGIRVAVQGSTAPAPQQPDSTRKYRYQQYFGFVQDTVRVTQRLTVNAGVRYELFGSPSNTGAVKDRLVVLGTGNTLAQQLTTAQFTSGNSGDQQLFGADTGNWSLRAGLQLFLLELHYFQANQIQ